MTARPIFRPMPFLRAVCRMTASLTGNTVPARSRAILYFGHSIMVIDFVLPCCGLAKGPMCSLDGRGRPLFAPLFEAQESWLMTPGRSRSFEFGFESLQRSLDNSVSRQLHLYLKLATKLISFRADSDRKGGSEFAAHLHLLWSVQP